VSKGFNNAVSAARWAAFEVLRRIESEAAFSAILLPQYEEDLKPEDRGLCHEIVLGVLRNRSWLDALIEHFTGKKIAKLDLPVVLALQIGLYQLRFLTKIPARAAVNESVNLVYKARLRSAAGFVNAVLRKSEREKDFNPLDAIKNPLEKLAVETSHPLWLLEKWQGEFGFDAAASLARANNQSPPTAFRITVSDGDAVLEELKNAGAELVESKIAPAAWRVSGAGVKVRELVAQSRIYLQDEASQLVANVCDVSGGENFLDVCAAPGSKTTCVAISNSKFQIPNSKQLFVAGDLTVPRIKILRETVEKYAKGNVQILQYDAAAGLPFADESFDCVLVDAPCSGTGTIRHNPDIRWHLRESDFNELAEKQLKILTNAARTVKKGGRIIYSTCSIEREENESVVERFLAENKNFEKAEIKLPPNLLTDNGFARTFPQRDDVDGFFIAQLSQNHRR
jgi:16S rRNA (cytosine967-C5)-methyltransferase